MLGRRPGLKNIKREKVQKRFEEGMVGTNFKFKSRIALRPTSRCRNVTKAASGADDIANILDPNPKLILLDPIG